jgi:zinc transporter 1/2/3
MEEESQHLRIGAVFGILVSSALGVLSPVLSTKYKYFKPGNLIYVLSKSFGCGVILATGFIHMFETSVEALTKSLGDSYPYASLFAVSAVFVVLCIE